VQITRLRHHRPHAAKPAQFEQTGVEPGVGSQCGFQVAVSQGLGLLGDARVEQTPVFLRTGVGEQPSNHLAFDGLADEKRLADARHAQQ
jgi:hypothetical protein